MRVTAFTRKAELDFEGVTGQISAAGRFDGDLEPQPWKERKGKDKNTEKLYDTSGSGRGNSVFTTFRFPFGLYVHLSVARPNTTLLIFIRILIMLSCEKPCACIKCLRMLCPCIPSLQNCCAKDMLQQ
jgi:hypothetical protein